MGSEELVPEELLPPDEDVPGSTVTVALVPAPMQPEESTAPASPNRSRAEAR
jgi:hypothetical protein